ESYTAHHKISVKRQSVCFSGQSVRSFSDRLRVDPMPDRQEALRLVSAFACFSAASIAKPTLDAKLYVAFWPLECERRAETWTSASNIRDRRDRTHRVGSVAPHVIVPEGLDGVA